MLLRMRRDEGGFVMVTVLLVVFVLLLAGTAILDRSVGSQYLSRHDQDWNASLAAAEGGIDDYLYLLNNSGVIPPPTAGNTAISPSWKAVPGPANGGQFSYTVDSSTLTVDGTIKLTVSGRVNNVVRTVQATFRRKTFLDYLYFTNYETVDPARYPVGGSSFNSTTAQTLCSKYYYGGLGNQRDVNGRVDFVGDSDTGSAFCTDIFFISQDTINGPLHTNDALLLSGNPTFNGATTTSWSTSPPRYRCPSGTCSPTFALSGDPSFVQPLTMPPTNTTLKAVATAAGGCLYTGPTRIVLNSAGTMTVTSPFTRSTNSGCGTGLYSAGPGTGASVTVPLPTSGVVYVQTVPASSSDPNFTSGCPYNVNAFGVSRAHPLGYPVPNDVTTYNCRDGDVFVSGTLRGQVTIASETDIIVRGNITYQSGVTGTDLLGLIPNNYVWVYHPVTGGGSNITGANGVLSNPVINAAMLSLQHSFGVQNFSRGSSLGTLNVTGAIGQQYRGPVGTFSGSSIVSGYAKNYVYDNRLKYLSPPYFIDPVQSAWHVATWAECVPQNPPSTTVPVACN